MSVFGEQGAYTSAEYKSYTQHHLLTQATLKFYCVCVFFFSNVHNCNLFFQCRTQPRAFIIHGCHASLFFSLELLVPSLCLMPLTSSRHTASGFVPLSLSSPEHFLGWFTVAWKGCVCAAVLLSVFYTTRLLMSVSEACCI